MCKAITIHGEPWSEERCKACLPALWSENEDAYEAFIELQLQITLSSTGIPVSIRFEAIESYLRIHEIAGWFEKDDLLKKVSAASKALVKRAQDKK